MGQIYANWDRMDEGKKALILADAADWLGRMEAGEAV